MHGIRTAIQLAALVLLGLVTGAMFGIWAGYNPAGYSASSFVEVHQGAVRGLNVLLPAMGFLAIGLTAALAFLSRSRGRALRFYLGAMVLAMVAGLVTRLANQPINDIVMTWTTASPPADWTSLRDSWWAWHQVRLGAGFAAFVLLILGILSVPSGAAAPAPLELKAGA